MSFDGEVSSSLKTSRSHGGSTQTDDPDSMGDQKSIIGSFPKDKINKRENYDIENFAIRVKNLSKSYQIYDAPRDRLKQFLLPRFQRLTGIKTKTYFQEFWALDDVSFEIKKGETVGIIGRNGSGKSTLLQLICGTLTPTSGSVETQGRIAALLELGSGFNPEFTGRENVYMNGAILGLRKEEVDARFEDIASFADIGKFIEQPVKTYSSGMFLRLAFAVNIISQPDIMIVDEALAVGDMNFQAKCMTALTRIQNDGATVLFVSHDTGAVKSLCKKAIYLETGSVKLIGDAPTVAEQYVRLMREEMSAEVRRFSRASSVFLVKQENTHGTELPKLEEDVAFKRSDEFDRRVEAHRYGSGGVKIAYVELIDKDDNALQTVEFNQEVRIRIYAEAESENTISINFNIRDDKKINLVGCGFAQASHDLLETQVGGRYVAEYTLRLPLRDGSYSLRVQVSSPITRGVSADFIDVVEDAVVFRVERSPIWSKVHLFPSLRLTKVE